MGTNVIQLIPMLDDAGAETLIKNYCIVAKRENIGNAIPVVIWGGVDSANVKELEANGIEIKYIFKKRNIISILIKKIIGRWYIPWKINEIVKEKSCSSVHFHLNTLQYAQGIAKKNDTVKLYYTCHSIVSHYFPNKKCKNYKYAVELLKKGKVRFIALHNDMKKELDAFFGIDNTLVINNGIDFKKFENLDGIRTKYRCELGIPEDAFVIGHVGRLEYEKNHIRIISLFEKILKEKSNSYLVLVGDGSLKTEIMTQLCKRQIENRVLILSHRSDVNNILKTMDAFLFPSIFEGMPLSVIEAQLSGLKCVISDCVTREVCISNLVHYLNLEQSDKCWINEILLEQNECVYYENYSSYDINSILRELFKIYK